MSFYQKVISHGGGTALAAILFYSAAAFVSLAFSDEPRNKIPVAHENTFIEKAAKGGTAEVELSRIAIRKTNDQKIKDFANAMVADHQSANEKLMALVKNKKWKEPAMTDGAHQAQAQELNGKNGKDFDRSYVAMMQKDHETAVSLFREEAKQCATEELCKFIQHTLPTLEHHLDMANQLGEVTADR